MMGQNNRPRVAVCQNTFQALMALFPSLNPSDLWKLTLDIHSHQKREHYHTVISDAEHDFRPSLKDEILSMHRVGFAIEQILLYVEAPEQCPSGVVATKSELLDQWGHHQKFVLRISSHDIAQRTSLAVGSLAAIAGVSVVSGGIVVGLLTNDKNIEETFHVLGQTIPGTTKTIQEAINQASPSALSEAALLGLGIGLGGWSLSSAIADAKTIDLRSKVQWLQSDTCRHRDILERLKDIGPSGCHLMSHFSPQELVLFLEGDDRLRSTMWSTRPPTFEQRCKSALCTEGKLFQKWREALQVTASSWNKDIPLVSQQVTLKQNVQSLRQKNAQKSSIPSLGF